MIFNAYFLGFSVQWISLGTSCYSLLVCPTWTWNVISTCLITLEPSWLTLVPPLFILAIRLSCTPLIPISVLQILVLPSDIPWLQKISFKKLHNKHLPPRYSMQQGLVFAHPNDLRMTNFSRLPKLGNQLSGTTASFPSTDPQPFVFFDQVCHLSTTVINNMPTAIPPIEAAPPAAITLFDKRAASNIDNSSGASCRRSTLAIFITMGPNF